MSTIVRKNERSWAIDLISKINIIAKGNDLVIKKAGAKAPSPSGEETLCFQMWFCTEMRSKVYSSRLGIENAGCSY